jgi:hypothetical protein
MKQTHTPGPWRYDTTGRFNNPSHDDKSGSIIAEPESSDDWIVAEICGDCPSTEANARLISAAPDLLEALQTLIATELPHGVFFDCEIEEQARAAIKKATTPC